MARETHFVLTCTKGHVWHEPIPTKKTAIGEHRLCPKCGGSSWIAPDAPRVTNAENVGKQFDPNVNVRAPLTTHSDSPKITLSQEFVSNVTSNASGEDISVIGAGRGGKSNIDTILGRHFLTEEKKVSRKSRPGVINIVTEPSANDAPSPASVAQTKKVPIPTDLIPTRKLLNETSDVVTFKSDDSIQETVSGNELLETLRNELKANN